jgi:hypothetical protein
VPIVLGNIDHFEELAKKLLAIPKVESGGKRAEYEGEKKEKRNQTLLEGGKSYTVE